jgi:diguanylate cyclase (GGDEF)-like protein
MRNSLKTLFEAPDANAPVSTQAVLAEMTGIKTTQLKWLFLGPVIAITFIMIGALVASVYLHTNDEINHEVRMLHTSANEVYQGNLGHLTGILAGITGTMSRNAELRSLMAKSDHAKLSRLVEPIFAKLQNEYGITYLYFIEANRAVLLRAHSPVHFGDVINRVTTLDAQRTKAPAHGVELGTEGELALRFVSPLYMDEAKQHPIGFIELGIDTSNLLIDIQKSLGIQMFEFLSKEFLYREVWQKGVLDPANQTEWDRFPDVAPSAQTLKNMTPEMSAIMSSRIFPSTEAMMKVSHGESDFRAISFPILDIEKHEVASIVMLADVTSKVSNARNTLYMGMALGVAGGCLLFAFFWMLTSRLSQLIEQHQEALHHLATRDGLTGLFNHVTFYTMLEDEITRSQRSGTPVSLLMLDLDHFKATNEKFGNEAGDLVLKEFGKVIHRQSRSIDKVCRYGGEEITVILPETDAAGAMITSERMRAAVEEHLFKLQEGQDLSITISIGVATVPEHAASAQELVNVADRALYLAKERGRNQVCRYNS